MKFGARTIKTGLAVVLAIYIAELLNLEPVVYAAVAATLTVMPTLYRAWKHTFEQIKANLIGASIAITTLLLVDGVEPWIIGLVVVMAIAINISLGFEKSISIVVLVIIAILEAPEGTGMEFAINRIILISVGILSSVFVNIVFLPPKHEKRLLENIYSANEHITGILKLIIMGDVEEKAFREEQDKTVKSVKKAKDLYELYLEEQEGRIRKIKYSSARKIVVLRKLTNNLDRMYYLLETIEAHYFHKTGLIPDTLQDDIQNHLHSLLTYNERILMKFDGRIKSAKKHEKNEELYDNNRHLIAQVLELTKGNGVDETCEHVFPIVSSFVEITNELNKIEQLVESLQNHHNE